MTNETSLYQAATFLLSVCLGAVLCLIYDIFRVARLAKKPSRLSGFVQDVVFALIAALLTFFIQMVRSSGEVRWFILTGELSGFIVCRMTVSRFILLISAWIIRIIKAVCKFIKIKIILPARKAIRLIAKKTEDVCLPFMKKLTVLLKKALKKGYNMVYNVKKKNNRVL